MSQSDSHCAKLPNAKLLVSYSASLTERIPTDLLELLLLPKRARKLICAQIVSIVFYNFPTKTYLYGVNLLFF